jgi:valyl-tRNA synthetase
MKRFHVRNAVVKALKEKGLYIETKDNPMQIPLCSKSGDIIESIMKPQWWVNCQPMAQEAIKVRGDVKYATIHVLLTSKLPANRSWRACYHSQDLGARMVPMDE